MEEQMQEIDKLESIFARELTPQLASVYVRSLLAELGGTEQQFEQLVDKGVNLHEYVGEQLYGPLIVGYVKWLEEMCTTLDHSGPVFFALRDAAPLEVAAKILWANKQIYPLSVYANRPMLNIEDEIDPQWANANGKVVDYLKKLGLVQAEKVIWADTGAWGTVVKALKIGVLGQVNFYPLFWYSHNPHIPGYLNGLLAECKIDDKFGELLNDSVECVFPQPHIRPVDVVKIEENWQVKLEVSCYLSQKWGYAALHGVEKSALAALHGELFKDEHSALLHLQHLSSEAKETGKWTGVLPTNTPTWSKGEEFLANWPVNLLP